MRLTLARLLGRNPLSELQNLMQAASACVAPIPALVEALIVGDHGQVVQLAKQISQLEGAADLAKSRLRDQLPRSLFLPVDRRDVLQLIVEIDAIADRAEDAGVVLTWRPLEVPLALVPLLRRFITEVMATVTAAEEVVAGLEEVLQSAFSARAVEAQLQRIRALSAQEHVADKVQDQLAKALFTQGDALPAAALILWTHFLKALADMANHAENVGDRVRLFLAR